MTTLKLLTASGYSLGEYTQFPGGGQAESRAFVYRPDIGFHELASLVAGGIAAQGWVHAQSATAVRRCRG